MMNKATEETLRAAREASAYFEKFDKANLYHAAAHRDNDWLLAEDGGGGTAGEPLPPSSGLLIQGLLPPSGTTGRYALLVPQTGPKALQLQELHQIVRELVEGIYVFNQIPSIAFEPNHDCSSSCFLPSAYHDTLVGEELFSVDYFIKSLLHGTTITQRDKRNKLNENWRKILPNDLHKIFTEGGMTRMEDDPELGEELYHDEPMKRFVRYPPKHVDPDLAYKDLSPQLSTGEEHCQHSDHISRDVFRRYLDQVSIGLVMRQKSVQQLGSLLVADPTFDVTTSVLCSQQHGQQQDGREIFVHLHTYLQKQRDFVAQNLYKKAEVAHSLDLLNFISFLVPFLVTLKRQNKVVDVSKLCAAVCKELLGTERELLPVLPGKNSRWAPFVAENSYTSTHGSINFHILQQTVVKPGEEFNKLKEASESIPLVQTDLPVYEINGQTYHLLTLPIADYYSKSPKLPRWLHSMIAELKIQCGQLHIITDSRAQDFLRRSLGLRQAAKLKTLNVMLPASIEKGVLPVTVALIKRCTKTRLNKVDENGRALVHSASANCRPDVLSTLLRGGCNPSHTCQSPQGEEINTQPIHLAAQSGGLETVCCLLRYGAPTSVPDDQGWTPMHYAAFHNYQTIVTHLAAIDPCTIEAKTGDRERATPLLLAALNGGYDTVKVLVDLGANLSATNGSERTIVHIATLHHHINILKYLIELNRPDLPVWEILSSMLAADPSTGYPDAGARVLDPLTRWCTQHYTHLLKHNTVGSLVKLLEGEERLQHLSVQVLANLSNIKGMRSALEKEKAIPSLVKLLSSTSDRIQSCTCVVLSDLATLPDNQATIVKAGAVPPLVKLLQSENDDVQLYSSACLGILAFDNPHNQTAIAESNGIPALATLLSSSLPCIQACAASSLQAILEGNGENQLKALTANIIPLLVALLQSKAVSVHCNAASAIEALAEGNPESQKELLSLSSCICLLVRLLRMREARVKVSGGCALWAIAGSLISNKRYIAMQMGVDLLVDMLTIHHEKLDFVCSEALGALATELGGNQSLIASVGGIRPLVEVLTIPTSQRVCLSVIHTLAALTMRPALIPNRSIQKAIATARGITVLAALVSSHAPDIIRVEVACTLAKIVLDNPENDAYLAKYTNFSYPSLFKFFTSADASVRLLAGYCLAVMAFNNPAKLDSMKSHGSLNVANFTSFLQSEDEFFQVHAAFQIVVLARLLSGVRDVEVQVQGIRLLVKLCSSQVEQTKVLSAEFIATLAHSREGIPDTVVMAGATDPLIANLQSGNVPVIESACVALGYLTFNPTASRLLLSTFRDHPELYTIFMQQSDNVAVSKKFLEAWSSTEQAGLPSLSLEVKGGPPVSQGWRVTRSLSRLSTGLQPSHHSLPMVKPRCWTLSQPFPNSQQDYSSSRLPRATSWQQGGSRRGVGPLTKRKLSLLPQTSSEKLARKRPSPIRL